jgi:endonuclease/exonuclease/phosphatase family metal-dependent hydrolase
MRTLSLVFILCTSFTGCDKEETVRVLATLYLNTVTVMTFNIFNYDHSPADERNIISWSDGRDQLVISTIESKNPDIVGLQEAYMAQVFTIRMSLLDYDFVGRGRDEDGGGESVSILFKKDKFELRDSGHFWLSDTPDEEGSEGDGDAWGNMDVPRMVTWVRLKRKDTDKCFYVYNTHFASDGTGGSSSRRKSALLLAERIAERAHPLEYFFVTGDFNAGEEDFPIRYLTGNAAACSGIVCSSPPPFTPVKMIDSWRSQNSGEGGTRCRNNGTGDGSRIDYIFVWNPVPSAGLCDASSGLCDPPGVTLSETVRWGSSCASDHRAVFSSFLIPLAPN